MIKLLRNLKISAKLGLAFGILAAFTLLSVSIVVASHLHANQAISTTADVRVPTALLADQAQANLLKMQAEAIVPRSLKTLTRKRATLRN